MNRDAFSALFAKPLFQQFSVLGVYIHRHLFWNFPLQRIILKYKIGAGLSIIGERIKQKFLTVEKLSAIKAENLKAAFCRGGFKGYNILIFDL